MTEHLTEQEVSEMNARVKHENTRGISWQSDNAYNAFHADIPRLIADWRVMRKLLHDLTAPEKAGIDDSGVYAECICCGALAMTNLWRDVPHAPDCPIVRGRALVQP